jgi:hypothetical protein
MSDTPELEFVSTETLISELLGRYDHAVFGGMNLPVDSQYVMHRRWKGNSATCIGMAGLLASSITEYFEENVDWRSCGDEDDSDVELGSDD